MPFGFLAEPRIIFSFFQDLLVSAVDCAELGSSFMLVFRGELGRKGKSVLSAFRFVIVAACYPIDRLISEEEEAAALLIVGRPLPLNIPLATRVPLLSCKPALTSVSSPRLLVHISK